MNGRWKRNGIELELFKQRHDIFRFDRMIPAGSSWLMGVKVKRIVGKAHSMIEKGKKVPSQKLHYMMGHTKNTLSIQQLNIWAFRSQEN